MQEHLYDEELLELAKQKNYPVIMHNALARARFDLTAQEQKIVKFAVSKITPFTPEPVGKKNGVEIEFDTKEYCELFDINTSGKNYADIFNSAKAVRDKSVWVNVDAATNKKATVAWFQHVTAEVGSGKITVEFDYRLTPYLYKLNSEDGHQTIYTLLNISGLKSKYSIRLFEYLTSFSSMVQPVWFSIDVLKYALEAENYYRFPDFKRYVLEVAVGEEINAKNPKGNKGEINYKTDLQIKWQAKKHKSRSFNRIYFWIVKVNELDFSMEDVVIVDPNQMTWEDIEVE